MGGGAALIIWALIIGLVVWLVVRRSRRAPRSVFTVPTDPPAPEWTTCDRCGNGNHPNAAYCQWCAAPLTPPHAVLGPGPPAPPPAASVATPNPPNPATVVTPPAPDPATATTQAAPAVSPVPVDRPVSSLAPAPAQDNHPATSVADEIAKLGELHDAGKLTDDEFAAFKAKLME